MEDDGKSNPSQRAFSSPLSPSEGIYAAIEEGLHVASEHPNDEDALGEYTAIDADMLDASSLSSLLAKQLESFDAYFCEGFGENLDFELPGDALFHRISYGEEQEQTCLEDGAFFASRGGGEEEGHPRRGKGDINSHPPHQQFDEELLESLLMSNRKYQQALREQLILLEEGQKMTRELQRWLRMLLLQVSRKKARGSASTASSGSGSGMDLSSLASSPAIISTSSSPSPSQSLPSFDQHSTCETTGNAHTLMRMAPVFVAADGSVPPEGEETTRLKAILAEYSRAAQVPARWTERERQALTKGICEQNQQLLIDRMLESAVQSGGIQPGPIPSPSPSASASAYRRAIAMTMEMGRRDLELNLEGLDWNRIAALFVPTRTAEDCRIQWTTMQHPLISHAPFATEERERLMAVAERMGERGKWIEIAQELGTDRTAWQCLAAYSQARARSAASGKWTTEEDRLLTETVQLYGETDCWCEISELLALGRTVAQCQHRWFKSLSPVRNLGRWTAEEDAWLLAAVARHGSSNWWMVQQYVATRNDMQCRERYMNVLDPHLRKDVFTEEEDRLLREAVERIGEGRWSQVATLFPNRTDNQCRRRWNTIKAAKPANPAANASDTTDPRQALPHRRRGRPRKFRRLGRPPKVRRE